MREKKLFSKPPSVVINSDEEVLIEGKLKLTVYTSEKVVVDVEYKGKCAVVVGEELKLRVVGENVFSVNGKIKSFSYVKKGEI